MCSMERKFLSINTIFEFSDLNLLGIQFIPFIFCVKWINSLMILVTKKIECHVNRNSSSHFFFFVFFFRLNILQIYNKNDLSSVPRFSIVFTNDHHLLYMYSALVSYIVTDVRAMKTHIYTQSHHSQLDVTKFRFFSFLKIVFILYVFVQQSWAQHKTLNQTSWIFSLKTHTEQKCYCVWDLNVCVVVVFSFLFIRNWKYIIRILWWI